MNQEVKRRIVMSLVSLALAFGLLATYYIVTVPWNRTAVGQALTAGSILGIAALVMQFMPIQVPVPAAASQQQAEPSPQTPKAHRSWKPEPDFAAEDFQTDLATAPLANPEPAPVLPSPTPVAAPIRVTAQTVSIAPATIPAPETLPPPAPDPRTVPVSAPPTLNNSPMTPDHLETIIEAADEEGASRALSLDEIKDSGEVLMVRNDHVRVDAYVETAPPSPPARAYIAEPARAAAVTIVAKTTNVAPRSTDPERNPGGAARPMQAKRSLKSEWREPDPETPKELLRELAEYWHVKYETERKRHNETLLQYEDVVRRREVLETREPVEVTGNGPTPVVDQLPVDEMTVADAIVHEGKNDLEDRWDRRAAQMERFH